jgi:hypothetical protein
LGGHLAILALTTLVAMVISNMDMLTRILSIAFILFLFPFILSIVSKKPAPPPPVVKKEEFVDSRGFSM